MKRVAIIGGGASGYAAAITIARKSNAFTVTIYEKLQKPLKKLLATGNGRCNLTNITLTDGDYFGDANFASAALKRFSPQSNLAFFREMGLLCKTEAMGRVYPTSGQASSVRDALCAQADRFGVRVKSDCEITDIQAKNEIFLLNGHIECDCVLICAGGCAAPNNCHCAAAVTGLYVLHRTGAVIQIGRRHHGENFAEMSATGLCICA